MTITQADELDGLKRIGRIVANTLREMSRAVEPGMTTRELDEIGAAAQPGDKRVERGKIVGIVGVAHDDVAAVGGLDAADQGRAITALRDRHHAGAMRPGDVLRAVGGAVVGDHHLADHAGAFEVAHRLVDAYGKRLGLVQAGHQDRQFDGLAPGFLDDRLDCHDRPSLWLAHRAQP